MQTIRQIYDEYKIMPSLQLHQLRVAAVAKMICANLQKPIDADAAVLACLFHDMGNILKFNLAYFPEFLEPKRLEYWKSVKEEFAKKYGTNQHEASEKIAKEIGLPETVINCISAVGFSKASEILAGDSWEKKICEYSDMRVGPFGVLTLSDRIMDGRKRYITRGETNPTSIAKTDGKFDELFRLLLELEKQIFASAKIKPEDITDGAIQTTVEELKDFRIVY